MFLGEFGATSSVQLLEGITAAADAYDLSWVYWQWKLYPGTRPGARRRAWRALRES